MLTHPAWPPPFKAADAVLSIHSTAAKARLDRSCAWTSHLTRHIAFLLEALLVHRYQVDRPYRRRQHPPSSDCRACRSPADGRRGDVRHAPFRHYRTYRGPDFAQAGAAATPPPRPRRVAPTHEPDQRTGGRRAAPTR